MAPVRWLSLTTQLWHIDAVREPSTPSNSALGAPSNVGCLRPQSGRSGSKATWEPRATSCPRSCWLWLDPHPRADVGATDDDAAADRDFLNQTIGGGVDSDLGR